MEELKKIRWFANDNEVTASLMNWFVRIKICVNDKYLYFPLSVYSDNQELLTFNFYTYEDAIAFTNNVIDKSWTTEEILEKYQEMYSENTFSSPFVEKNIVQNDKIILTPDEVDQAIVEYFGSDKEYNVSCKEELAIENGEPKLDFYLIEHTKINDIRRDVSTRLMHGDLMHALGSYIGFYGYDLIDFKYYGGVHRVGYYFDEDTPYYGGVELSVKKKEKEKTLELKKDDLSE